MPRDYKVFLQDVLEAIGNVAEFVGRMTQTEFAADKKTVHAVVRNLEVIGEAIKSVPPEVRDPNPQVPWQRIAGLRDILIHHYFQIDIDIVWDIVQNKLPELKWQIEGILADPGEKTPA
ncbi:MAG TPA: DUF86 domain-containing protein [Gemmataceae bacterium]|jgi:uncharacterized protein with HEPN domain|nr:DUF86 domain-containing protein [Gemmataceae bacterium]